MYPSYLQLKQKEIKERISSALSILHSCQLCPRKCLVNRHEGETGFCQAGRYAFIASYNLHFGEERPLVGQNGSGTIFFSGCNLGCIFCQNYDISHTTRGAIQAKPEQLAAIMLELQKQGAHNINLVTPTHVLPQILESLPIAIDKGLNLPLVYNSGGYDEVDSLQLLEGIIDIYMPDTKFANIDAAKKYCNAEDYPEKSMLAIKEMHRQTGDLQINENGIALRGLIIRHLLMPQGLSNPEDWFRFLAQEISLNTYLNIMDQYYPCGKANLYSELKQGISPKEHMQAIQLAQKYGLTRQDQRKRPPFTL